MEWRDPVYLTRLIENCDGTQFVSLCNDLLSETAARHNIDRSCLATNLHVSEPDGGIDARCVGSTARVGRLIPLENVAYQFKSGETGKSARKIAEDDILGKPRVRELLQQNYAFVYMAAWDRGDQIESDICDIIRADGLSVRDGQIIFIGNDAVARLLQTFPGLIAKYLRLDIPLIGIDQWTNLRSLRNPFKTDKVVETRLKDLLAQIEPLQSVVRVVGAAGNGKTRTVLEALCNSPLALSVLYARQVEDVTNSFRVHLERTPDIRCTVVVDEVDDSGAAELIDRFSNMPPGVRLVMIGLDASGRAQSRTLQVDGLGEDLLVEMISAISPGVPLDVVRSIASDCEHSPKLAVIIAERIKEEPGLIAPQRRLADGTVRNALDQYLRVDQDSPGWNALSTTALLMRLGWRDEVEYESEKLFRAVDLDPATARRLVESLHGRLGIAPLAGRYRYISPAILADYLASQQLESWTRQRFTNVLSALTPTMMESFAKRARRLSSILSNRRTIEEVILGDQGPFRNLADLETGRLSSLLRHLAAPFPNAALSALKRIIDSATIEELRSARNSRRDIVWAIETLLWPEATFEASADLLLRLAIAENETWGNNATNTWIETFQMVLGRTAAGAAARARVLHQAARQTDPTARLLCARAIGKACLVENQSRLGMPPQDVEGMPAQEWQPGTYGEWADAIVTCLKILEPMLRDSEAAVRQVAAEAFSQAVMGAFQLPCQVFEEWARIAQSMIAADFTLRKPMLESIHWAQVRYGRLVEEELGKQGEERAESETRTTRLAEMRENLAKLESIASELRGDEFSSRLHWAISCPIVSRSGEWSDNQKELSDRFEGLATEALAHPNLLDSEWEWLTDAKGKDLWHLLTWFEVLGSLDKERIFEPVLDSLAMRSPGATMFASRYDLSHAQAIEDPHFIERRVDWLRAAGATPLRLVDLLFRSGYAGSRLSLIIELLESNTIAAASIDQLAYPPWGSKMPAIEALRIAEAAARQAVSAAEILPFVSRYLGQVEEAIPDFRELALRLLSTSADQIDRDAIDEWSELARVYAAEQPLEISATALQLVAKGRFDWSQDLNGILQKVWEVGDKARIFTEVFGPWLLSDYAHMLAMKGDGQYCFPVSELGVEFLVDWITAEPSKRARPLARIIGAPTHPPSELHIALLERFDDYGVGDEFSSDFMTGVFWGHFSDRISKILDVVQQWTDDPHPVFRNWARQFASWLERELQHQRSREEEERFSRS